MLILQKCKQIPSSYLGRGQHLVSGTLRPCSKPAKNHIFIAEYVDWSQISVI